MFERLDYLLRDDVGEKTSLRTGRPSRVTGWERTGVGRDVNTLEGPDRGRGNSHLFP